MEPAGLPQGPTIADVTLALSARALAGSSGGKVPRGWVVGFGDPITIRKVSPLNDSALDRRIDQLFAPTHD
jgi:hypothetical protein